jgi:hypothetical protein
MPSTENETPKFLIDLIINQDQVTQKWVEFLIAIQAGLVVVLGYLLRSSETRTQGQSSLPHAAFYLIPAIGILTTIAISLIIIRERQWTAWYVDRFNKLPGCKDDVFPTQSGQVGSKYLRLSSIVGGLAIVISLGWVVTIIWAMFLW